MSYDVATKFAPGEVTPEQLEKYRQKYEEALRNKKLADDRYHAAYFAYSAALAVLTKAESVYEWAKHGMVQEPTQ